METNFKVLKKIETTNYHIFDVEKWSKIAPNGKEGIFVKLNSPDWVGAVVFDLSTKKFVCVKEYRHGVDKTVYQFPCGTVEKDENHIDALKRELCEELGIEKKDIDVKRMLYSGNPNPAFMDNTMTYYYVEIPNLNQKEQKLDNMEFINVEELDTSTISEILLEPDAGVMLKLAWMYVYLKENSDG